MSASPQPGPNRSGSTHPELKGISAEDITYHFNPDFLNGCDALFNATLPSAQAWQLQKREELHNSILAAINSGSRRGPDADVHSYELIAVGLSTDVFVEEMRGRHTFVPFIANHSAAIEAPSSQSLNQAQLVLGLYSPDIGSFSLITIGQPDSPIRNPASANALVPALQWMELVERLGRFSHSLNIAAMQFVYEAKLSPELRAATGSEVCLETLSRRLTYSEAAFSRCRELNLEVSPSDLYRGIKQGAVTRSPETEEIFSHFEDYRAASRVLTPRYQEVVDLLSRKRLFFLNRFSLKQANAINPNTDSCMAEVENGLRALKMVEVGVGSPLGILVDSIHRLYGEISSIQSSISSRKDGSDFCSHITPAARLIQLARDHLCELEKRPTFSDKSKREEFLAAVKAISIAEKSLLETVRLFRCLTLDPEIDSSGSVDDTYSSSIEALRLMRRTFNRCLPGLLEFVDQ